jgi:hypothetical protein
MGRSRIVVLIILILAASIDALPRQGASDVPLRFSNQCGVDRY